MNAYSGLIRLPQVIELTDLSDRTIYRYEGKGYFPKKIKLNPNARNGAVDLGNSFFYQATDQSSSVIS